MHQLSIPQSIIDRVVAKRGREHVLRTSSRRGPRWSWSTCRMRSCCRALPTRSARWRKRSCPTSIASLQAVRASGGRVVWIKTTFKDDALRNWSTYFEMVSQEQAGKRIAALTADSKGHELWAALDVQGKRPHRGEEPLQRLHPGLLEPCRRPARTRPRYRPDHRHGHQRVLRVDGARCHDAQFQDHHGDRRQRRRDRRGPQCVARARSISASATSCRPRC